MMMSLMMMLSALVSPPAHAGPDDVTYFNQFLFKQENIGNDPDFPEYQYWWLMSNNNVTFTNANGQAAAAEIELQLYPTGQYILQYQELAGTAPNQYPAGCKIVNGSWSVPDTTLLVQNVGTGGRAYDATNVVPNQVQLTFTNDIISAGLTGASVTLAYGVFAAVKNADGTYSSPDLSQFCFSF